MTSLRGNNLSGANLSGTDLNGADLLTADLSGADLCGAKYSHVTLWPAECDPTAHGAELVTSEVGR